LVFFQKKYNSLQFIIEFFSYFFELVEIFKSKKEKYRNSIYNARTHIEMFRFTRGTALQF
jgi:hypothetical protein